ncbi:MAG TPA: hypothetical protein VMH02_11300 [Verrucomicrobiae bacterium]|nr:hypothetical protein [Verrucomicrobiae bacterium]
MSRAYRLKAEIHSANPIAVGEALRRLFADGSVRRVGDGFAIEAAMHGESAKDLNRTLLSALRKVEKKTTLRAEWTADGVTERYFDYVLKATREGES